MIDGDPDIGGQNMLVVAGDGWHRGVIGIVASKLVETYSKPALVLSIEDGIAHGSARSIPAFDLLGALESCADVFLRFGGHRQAAGVTIEAARIGELRRRLSRRSPTSGWAPRTWCRACASTRRWACARSPATSIEGLARLGPFGAANPKPVFRASPVDLLQPPRRLKERHLSLLLPAAGPVVPRDRLARRRARGVSQRQSLRPRAGVFARSGRIPGREDDRADRGRCPIVGRRRPSRDWRQKRARLVVAAIGVGAAVALFVLRRERAPATAPQRQDRDRRTRPPRWKAASDGWSCSTSATGKTRAEIDFGSSRHYEDGRNHFEKVHIKRLDEPAFELWADTLDTQGRGVNDANLPGEADPRRSRPDEDRRRPRARDRSRHLLRTPRAS